MGEVGAYLNAQKPIQSAKQMKKETSVLQTTTTNKQTKQDKTPESDLSEMEVSDLPDTEFKTMLIKMFTEVRRTKWDF